MRSDADKLSLTGAKTQGHLREMRTGCPHRLTKGKEKRPAKGGAFCNHEQAISFMNHPYFMKSDPVMKSGPAIRQTSPWASMALATRMKPAALAPSTRLPGSPYSTDACMLCL